jgi:hypothetical protein
MYYTASHDLDSYAMRCGRSDYCVSKKMNDFRYDERENERSLIKKLSIVLVLLLLGIADEVLAFARWVLS